MPRENVELVRSTLAAVFGGDLESARAGFHADAVWNNTAVFPDERTLVGPAAIIDFWQRLSHAWDGMASTTEIERVADSDERVVVGLHSFGKGRASGIPFDRRYGMVFRIRDGKISCVDIHGSWEKASRAADVPA